MAAGFSLYEAISINVTRDPALRALFRSGIL
jgi:hypothetical protein